MGSPADDSPSPRVLSSVNQSPWHLSPHLKSFLYFFLETPPFQHPTPYRKNDRQALDILRSTTSAAPREGSTGGDAVITEDRASAGASIRRSPPTVSLAPTGSSDTRRTVKMSPKLLLKLLTFQTHYSSITAWWNFHHSNAAPLHHHSHLNRLQRRPFWLMRLLLTKQRFMIFDTLFGEGGHILSWCFLINKWTATVLQKCLQYFLQ